MKKKASGETHSRRVAAFTVGALGAFGSLPKVPATQLPVPCVASGCGSTPGSPAGFVTSGKATAVQSGNSLAINQASNKAVLNWASFDVSADGRVTFNQPSSTSVALNRIFEGNPSAIFGSVSANGQIYLVNPNGFVFGKGATVNASGLIASSLGISDTVFNAGLLAPQLLAAQTPALQSADNRTTVVDNSGQPVLGSDGKPLPVQVTVQQGATLSTPGGRLLLAAPLVQNSGTLNAPDGQVVLAAGQQVFLAASTSPSLRGLIVEVDGGGTAANQLSGAINTARGNTTLVGLAVNQDGRISATTSVTANGTVRLEAGNQVAISGGGALPFGLASQSGGTLELGAQSSIDILPELSSSATAVKDQAQLTSEVDLVGQSILMHGGSIHAPSGIVNAVASANPSAGVQTDGNPLARVRVDGGTTIDVSGSSVELPMSANLLAIQLRANELADDPTQRNGALRGQTVYVDARVGSPLISTAAFQAAVSAVPETIGQRTTSGGTVNLESEGDVVIQNGATINVSGGRTTYDGGVLQTTQLAGRNSRLYDIGSANPLLTYTGVVNPTFTQTFNKWGVQDIVPMPGLSHYEAGYVQGAAAGTISIAAPALVLAGTLSGHAVNGVLQRSGAEVAGGQLQIGLPGGLNSNSQQVDFLAPSVTLVNQAAPIIVADDVPLPPQTVQLPIDFLTNGGFTRTSIYSNGTVTVPAGVPINLLASGSLSVQASRINIFSDITAPGGSIQLQNALTIDANDPSISRLGIDIGAGVSLDVRGQWTNDLHTPFGAAVGTDPVYVNGGRINIAASVVGSELVIGDGVAFHASGGAWLQANGKVSDGSGGSIALQSGPQNAAVQIGSGVELDAFGVGGASGGSFSFAAPRLSIVDKGSTWSGGQRVDDQATPGDVLNIGTSLFNNYGFSSVTLIANGAVAANAPDTDILTVHSGTSITPLTESLALQPGYQFQHTGAALNTFSRITTLPEAYRPPASVTLAVTPQIGGSNQVLAGLLDFQAGASIQTDPLASVSLIGVGGMYVDGTIHAPGGKVSLLTQTPISESDPGYLPGLQIELGPHAVLDVSGTSVLTPNSSNLLVGNVLPGGTVNLTAQRGSVVADAGSNIKISGTEALLDVPGAISGQSYTRYEVPSAGGSLTVEAPESISLLGKLAAQAGVGNYGAPAAGSLNVALTRSEPFFTIPGTLILQATFPTTPRVIQLVADTSGMTPSPAGTGLAVLGISELQSSGIDSLRLEAGDEVLFSSSAPIALSRQIVLDAPAIGVDSGVNATVTANYAALSNTLPLVSSAVVSTGTGSLTVNANQIDLIGSVVLQNIGAAHLTSSGDITLRTVFNSATQYGSLSLDGDLTLSAPRIYPATDSSFAITTTHNAADPASMVDSIALAQTTPSPGVPLSAGGAVTISADQVTSSGTLLAPFGSITLNATQSLNLAPGSVTSVSGTGMVIPYGSTQLGGQQWIYEPSGGDIATLTGIPARAVSLNAPVLSVASGATINLSGGGEIYAYEWVPGTGGSRDALGQNQTTNQAVTPGLYAVLPSLRGQFAPFDPQETPASGLTAGASIYLSGGAGLAAGIYPLLPARDALIPGAYLVQVQSGYNNIVPGEPAALADNTPVIAGYLTFGTTGLHSGGYQGVAVWPGSYGQSLAQYQITGASTYFAALASAAGAPRPNLPIDAGSLSIAALNGLDFLGSVLGNQPNSGGLSSRIDISAPQLEVTGTGPGGATSIAGSVIQGWKASQVVLGGHPTTDGTGIDVMSDSVTIDSGAQVSADQLILVANNAIDVRAGATVASTSATSGGAAPTRLPSASTLTLSSTNPGGAALLAVSDLSLPLAQRANSGAGGATISVEQGATVASQGALSLDGPGGVGLAGTLSGSGASWSLASGTIGFVGSGSSADTLQINSTVQAALQNAASVRLASQGAINLYTPVLLGSSASAAPTLNALTLSASSIVNQDGSGASVLGAKTLTLEGSATGAAGAPSAPTAGGSLTFVSNQLDIGPGALAVSGFQDTALTASSAVVGQGVGGVSVGGDLTITTPVLTAVGGAQSAFSTPGTLVITRPAQAGAAPAISNGLGGEIDLNANVVQVSGTIAAPAGLIKVQATQDINLSGSAMVDAGGRTVTIGGHSFGAEGGNVALAAAQNLALAAGSVVNVSGAGDAPAGSIALTAGGAADVLGSFSGKAGGLQGGSLSVEAGSLTEGLTPLINALQTGGFTGVDSIHTHTGDLTLSAGSALTANQITVTADTGKVEIGGSLSAIQSGVRGAIGLFGGTGVLVDAGAALHADTTGGTGVGGEIELGTISGGSVSLLAGSTLSAIGSSADGTLVIRAPIVGSDVAVNTSGADLSGLGQIRVEPVFTMPIGTTFAATDLASVETSVNSTMATLVPAITGRLNPSGSLPLVVQAAVDLAQSGSLTLTTGLDLGFASNNNSGWRPGGEPVDLSFRAGGSILVQSALSDGFTVTPGMGSRPGTLSLTNCPSCTPDELRSASFRLVAGADQASPDPSAIVAGTASDLQLAPGAIVRTGTGDINLFASGNIVFNTGSQVYTAGLAGAPPIKPSSSSFSFPTQGGNIRLAASGDILGSPVQQSVTAWQVREGGTSITGNSIPTQWGTDLNQFGWNVGSLGGGDVSVTAGGSIKTLSAAAADSYASPAGGGPAVHFASGGLAVTAGGDVGSGQFFVADGTSLLRAGGAFSAVQQITDSTGAVTNIGSLIALDDAQIALEARNGVVLEAVVNPTAISQIALSTSTDPSSYFFTYGGDSSLVVQSTTGDVSLLGNSASQSALMGSTAQSTLIFQQVYPATLIARALQQDVTFPTATLFPSDQGRLELVAGRDIVGGGSLIMSDAATADIPTPQAPVQGAPNSGNITTEAFLSGRHLGDAAPALILAGRDAVNLSVEIPKATDIIAGRDISNLYFLGQNLSRSDLTLVSAGRDIIDTSAGGTGANIQVGGPGRLDVLADRNVELGFSNGITTVGNTLNPNLATPLGADLTVIAGLGQPADYSDFLTKVIAPDPTNQGLLTAYVESLTGQTGLSYATAAGEFANFSADQRRPLFDQVFFSQLLISGRQANTVPNAGFSLGYAAIDTLFPGSRTAAATGPSPYVGDISLNFSRIYTTNGGNISLLVPGGNLDVGLANAPASLPSRSPSQLGIVAEGAGDVNIYTKGDVNVNSSRIFTLGGGNILIWSDEGSIDAGRGSKSSVSAPPPQVLVDSSGNVTLSFSGAVAGSGIRTIQINPTVTPGNVDLIAPQGTVNAGDAGIGAAGNINIAAQQVLGLTNIQFGGTSTGVPAQVSSIGASLSGASSAASSASNASTSAAEAGSAEKEAGTAPLAQNALSWLEVFVTGLGEENCATEDVECLKRQKLPAH